jgi:AcrR family transcriptional regulator
VQAGISEAELAWHYGGASACLYATYDEVAGDIYEEFAAALASERGWYDALRAGGVALMRRLSARPAEARLCFAEIFRGDLELLRRREASRRRMVGLFVRELGRRRDEPELFRVQLELLIGASFQAIATAVSERRVEELERLMPELESRAYVFEPAPI